MCGLLCVLSLEHGKEGGHTEGNEKQSKKMLPVHWTGRTPLVTLAGGLRRQRL